MHEEDIAERDRAPPSSALTRSKDGRAPPLVENDAEPGAGGRRVTVATKTLKMPSFIRSSPPPHNLDYKG